MFGNRKRVDALEQRLEVMEASLDERIGLEIERRMDAARAELNAAVERVRSRVEQDPGDRTRFLLNAVADDLQRELRAVLDGAGRARAATAEIEQSRERLQAMLRGEAGRAERELVPLGQVRRASGLGFVALWFDGGWTDKVVLRVGWSDPPETVVCKLNTANDINSYASTVVRPGEYWIADSDKGEKSGVKCIFTPFL